MNYYLKRSYNYIIEDDEEAGVNVEETETVQSTLRGKNGVNQINTVHLNEGLSGPRVN